MLRAARDLFYFLWFRPNQLAIFIVNLKMYLFFGILAATPFRVRVRLYEEVVQPTVLAFHLIHAHTDIITCAMNRGLRLWPALLWLRYLTVYLKERKKLIRML